MKRRLGVILAILTVGVSVLTGDFTGTVSQPLVAQAADEEYAIYNKKKKAYYVGHKKGYVGSFDGYSWTVWTGKKKKVVIYVYSGRYGAKNVLNGHTNKKIKVTQKVNKKKKITKYVLTRRDKKKGIICDYLELVCNGEINYINVHCGCTN